MLPAYLGLQICAELVFHSMLVILTVEMVSCAYLQPFAAPITAIVD
jgi:hypothetical protein